MGKPPYGGSQGGFSSRLFMSPRTGRGQSKASPVFMSRPETGGNDDGQTEDDAESNSNLVAGFPATSVLYQLSSLLDTSKLYKNEQQLLLILSTVGLWRNTMQKKLKKPTPVQLPFGSWGYQFNVSTSIAESDAYHTFRYARLYPASAFQILHIHCHCRMTLADQHLHTPGIPPCLQ